MQFGRSDRSTVLGSAGETTLQGLFAVTGIAAGASLRRGTGLPLSISFPCSHMLQKNWRMRLTQTQRPQSWQRLTDNGERTTSQTP